MTHGMRVRGYYAEGDRIHDHLYPHCPKLLKEAGSPDKIWDLRGTVDPTGTDICPWCRGHSGYGIRFEPPAPRPMLGWECPRCRKIHSPLATTCACQPHPVYASSDY